MVDISNAVTIVSIETTQAIQTFPATVPLVANKLTFVRLMARHNLGPSVVLLGARARMRVIPSSGVPSPWFDPANGTNPPAPNPGFLLQLKDAPDRSLSDDTFNFRIPGALCFGAVQWEFELRVDAKSVPAGAASGQARIVQRSVPMNFRPRKTLEIKYIRVEWNVPDASGTGSINTLPSDAKCVDAITRACQLLPVGPPLISSAFGVVMIAHPGPWDVCFDLLKRVFLFRDAVDDSTGGLVPLTDNSIWCAIFDYPNYAIRGESVIGELNLVACAETIPIAHELGHCLQQNHLDAKCPVQARIAFADDASNFPDGGQINDTPFDVIDAQVVPLAAGTAYWDLMTYCNGTIWTSPERWRRVWAEVGAP